jgi:hypothetical protein
MDVRPELASAQKQQVVQYMREARARLEAEWCTQQGPDCLRGLVAQLQQPEEQKRLRTARFRTVIETQLSMHEGQRWDELAKHVWNSVVEGAAVRQGRSVGQGDLSWIPDLPSKVEEEVRCERTKIAAMRDSKPRTAALFSWFHVPQHD